MPFRVTCDYKRRVALITSSGECAVDDAFAALREIACEPFFGPGWGVLADVRDCPWVPSQDEARQVTDFWARSPVLLAQPQAVVVGSPVQLGAASQIATMIELRGGKLGAFTDRATAEAWLAEAVRQAGGSTGDWVVK